jgi:uncharacterized protein (TIGR00269 family)
MKCSKCGGLAVINMRQHRLRLCEPHFLDWFVATAKRTIERYGMIAPDEKVLVAVSGGKDSLALWDVLLRLGFGAEGMYIDLGIDEGMEYSIRSLETCQRFVQEHHPDATLHVVDVAAQHGQTIPQVARRSHRGRGKPCSVCGLVKRHLMNRVAREDGFAAVATGHNLDDEAAVLMQNTLHWQTGYLARQAPVLAEQAGLSRKVKPLVRFYERETAAYALLRGIDCIYEECPFAEGSTTNFHKELLNQLELRSPGSKQQFYLDFLRARDGERVRFEEKGAVRLHACRQCGQPTTAGDLCAFCRLWK